MRKSFSSKIIACVCLASLLLAASPLMALAQNASRLAVAALRCEYLVSPLAVEARAPRLSWTIESNQRGAKQTAYHILVASSASLLAANRGDLWDTGKVASNQTIQIAYQGKPLASRQACFWKVRIWDQNDKPAAWSQPARWVMGLMEPGDWSAQWIGDKLPSVENVAATMLRREFELTAKPQRAIVYASALGVYELHINGQRVGDQLLAPEFTDYHTRTQYQAYDVTGLLRTGANAIGAMLGDGWYAGGIGLAQALLKKPRNIYGNHPRLIAQLEIDLSDGRKARIETDANWRTTREGPIRSADLLNGEVYDARREMAGWDSPGFNDHAWSAAEVEAHAGTQLVAQPNEPIRVTREIKPIAVNEPKPGVYVFDMGQNMVGWCRLKTRGAVGTTVRLRHAEMLNPDGTIYTENLRGAQQADAFTLRGAASEAYEPHFTYHGFRYVEVTGLAAKPAIDAITGRVFHSAMAETSSFETSDPLLNKLWQNILWTQRGNMESIPTDCPQRDERLGWMGDIQIFVGTGIFNMDMAAFFTKWMRDVRDAQATDGRFADFSPHPFGKDKIFTGVAGWGDAGIVVPWRVWQHYGDKRLLIESYDSARRWVEFIRGNNPDLLWKNKRGNDYGDWLNSDTLVYEGFPRKGGQVPKEVFATMMFAYATDLLSRIAGVIGKEDEAKKYAALFNDIRAAFNKAYVSEDGHIRGDTQAGYALALHFDLLPSALRPTALKYMLDGISRYNGHMSTGFHSTYRMMLELTRAGENEVAYSLVNQRGFPSWEYSIDNGATTIWERWDGYVKGRGFQDKGMNSFNHYAIGAVGEWMARVILGINNDDAHPAYEQFTLRPYPGGGLSWARGHYDSIRGRIESSWSVAAGQMQYNVTIPANTAAAVYVPAKDAAGVMESGKPASAAPGVKFLRMEDGAAVFLVQSGKYNFTAR
ncbi:MAG TPA: glycoside hydrolase family 78 protein [Blastocatellia bacterium]|nr:glycoside hydrolase family 78 protein [Blastocatellia bacterium]